MCIRDRYRTIIQESENGRETRQSSQLYPTWSLSLVYSYLRDYVQTSDASGAPTGFTERTALMQFFGQCRGSFTSFLLQPSLLTLVPADSSVQGQLLGVGDGTTTAFQMVQTVYGILDIVQNPQGTPTVYVGGVPTTAFTLGTTGIIVFSTPPALGAAISADFKMCIRDRDKEQYQALIDKKVELDQQYATKHQQIMTQMEQFDANALAKERSEFNSAFVGILTGQTTFSQGMLKLGESMFEGMANNILKMLETQKLAGLKQILVDAKTAAGNSYSWASAWGGPVAGAIAAAAAFAGVMAFGAFEAGGLVPNTGFHKLHEQEMVLPKNISNLITSSVSNFTTTGGQQNSSELHTHFSPNITAMDAKSVNAIMDDQYERFVAKIKTDFRHMRFA